MSFESQLCLKSLYLVPAPDSCSLVSLICRCQCCCLHIFLEGVSWKPRLGDVLLGVCVWRCITVCVGCRRHAVVWAPLNLKTLKEAVEKGQLQPGAVITMKTLYDAGLLSKKIDHGVKLLGTVRPSTPLILHIYAYKPIFCQRARLTHPLCSC